MTKTTGCGRNFLIPTAKRPGTARRRGTERRDGGAPFSALHPLQAGTRVGRLAPTAPDRTAEQEVQQVDSQFPFDSERAEMAEEILLHVRKIARRMQERLRRALDQPPPEDVEGGTPPPSLRRLPSRDPPFPQT